MAGKKFRFSLDGVLTVRHHQTVKAEQALDVAARARRMQEEQLAAAEANLAGLPSARPGAAIGLADIQRQAAHRSDAMKARAAARHALDASHRHEGTARRALTAARVPEEALVTLRERERAAHRTAALRAEEAVIDEHVTASYARRA